jgi:hypothetical protein
LIAERSLSAPRNGETFRPAAGAHGDHGLANRGVAQLVRNAQAVVEACRPKTLPDQNQPWDPTKCSTLMAARSLEKGCCGREAIQDCEAMECSFRGVSKIHPPLIYPAGISLKAALNQW